MNKATNAGSLLQRLLPFLAWLPHVSRGDIRADLIAGLTGAVIVLPQGVAYALIAGLPPQYGLYTAIVTPIVAALFGSSWHLVSGPTAAISIVVFSVVSGVVPPDSPQFIPYVLTVTFLAGVFQLLLGTMRMGVLVNFVSHTVVIGFTTGAAMLIASSQLRHFLGLTLPDGHAFIGTIGAVATHLLDSNPYAIAIGSATLLSAALIKRLRPTWPGMLLAMVIGSLFALAIDASAHGVALVGAMPAQLPPFSTPDFSLSTLRELAPGALAVAIIALVEAVAIARAVSMRSQQRIDGNQEFIGQGLSNIVGSFFSCYAGSGSFTRTGANYDAGARTPLAAIFAAILLSIILLVAPGLTAYLPMPAMAGIVLLIAWNLIDVHHLKQIIRLSRQETAVLTVTILATLFLALEFAIYAGVLVSLLLYLKRTAHPRLVSMAPMPERANRPLRNAERRGLTECPQLKLVRIDGSLFFGAANHVQGTLRQLSEAGYRHVLLMGRGVNFIDIAGAEMLAQEARRLRAAGGGLYLCSFKDHATDILKDSAFCDAIGRDHMFSSPKEAISAIFGRLDEARCRQCSHRIFAECSRLPPPEKTDPGNLICRSR
ncbi:MAG TPA: SulP family inorganic anion transporter [Modicisalibacter sp.]|nr:SulP family inorganic anion transporter [Modicisalibacter sp.]